MEKYDFSHVKTRFFFGFCHCSEQIELQAKLLNYFLGSNKSNINQCGSPKASTQVVHKLRSWSPQHFGIRNIANSLGKIISYRSVFTFRNSLRAQAAGLPRQGHVYKTTDESFRFHNKKIR